jgi:hypothetical protein
MKHLFVVVCVLALTGTDALAQVKSGLNEINFTATLAGSKVSGQDASGGATLSGAYGRFLMDRIEVGPQFNIIKADGSDAYGTIGGAAAYHFNPGSGMVGYAGGQLGTGFGLSNDFINNPWSFGFFAGVKAFLGESGAITLQPFWTRQSISSKVFDTSSEFYTFGVSAGVSVFWD